jgi:hypothetical protein
VKVVPLLEANEKQGGPGSWQMIDIGPGTGAANQNTTITLVLLTQSKSGKCNYWCCLFAFPNGGNRNIIFQDDGKIKGEKDIYHHGPKHIPIIRHLPESRPTFFFITHYFEDCF